jgi:murein DD-endopeptidase MepM/ murein hydrolase activator NlpD
MHQQCSMSRRTRVFALYSLRVWCFRACLATILPALMFTAMPAAAQSGAAAAQLLPSLSLPVVEVAAFRVAPVKPGDALRKVVTGDRPSSQLSAGTEKGIETRVQAAEEWADVLQRVFASLDLPPVPAELRAHVGLLPPLQPGKFLRARASAGGITEIDYVVQPSEAYTVAIHGGALQVTPLGGDPLLIERMRADPAKASLFTATNAIGLPESIALQLTEIFAGEVDFHRELHLGYRCAIVYEANYREGFIEKSGRILAVEMEVGGRRLQAYYSRDTQGRDAYFDQSGKTTRRMFRRSPVEFTPITSDFNLARFHPILGLWRAHRGVDYAAPMGAKVMAVADGVVEFVGVRGDYGNLIVLRHQDVFMTYYAHLNEFAPGLSVGNKVEQGQTIGRVGMSGLATGPHLHFEFHSRDVTGAWNAVPAPDVIETTVVAAPGFTELVNSYRTRLTVAETNLVVLD